MADEPCDDHNPTLIGAVNCGVGVTDNATGTGYLMYSAESVHTRFNGVVNQFNADHIIAVRQVGSQWQFNSNTAWIDFTPQTNDRLLADVDFSADTVASLQGTSSTIGGIQAGYASGDLTFMPNIWNGGPNSGEFGVTGTFFSDGGCDPDPSPVMAAGDTLQLNLAAHVDSPNFQTIVGGEISRQPDSDIRIAVVTSSFAESGPFSELVSLQDRSFVSGQNYSRDSAFSSLGEIEFEELKLDFEDLLQIRIQAMHISKQTTC